MKIELNFLKSIIIILSIACSLVYFDPSIPETDILEIDEGEYISEKDIILQSISGDDDLDSSTIDGNKPIGVLSSTTIEGNYALAGYFTHDQFTTLDDDGSVYVLEDYEDMRNKASLTISSTFEMNTIRTPTYPDQEDTYMPLKDLLTDTLSSMFTPVFWESTLIKGKIHVVTHISTNYIGIIDPPQIKVSVSIFNPQNGNTTEVGSYEEILPDDLSDLNQKIFELTLNDTYTIPAGNRLKLTFEGKISDLSDLAEVGLDSSSKGSGQYGWDIDDGVYSNNYAFGGYKRILGMQICYKSATFPEITVSGITNSTYYYEEKNIDISVTGAVDSSYRWDLENYTVFTDVASTSLPTTEGWHYLEVRASDSFNNTAIEVYEVGYDSTECYLILNDPSNNSIIESESLLNFSTFGANSIICEWDKNGTEIELLSLPDYNLAVPITEGYHNLTLILNDIFVLDEYYYVFGIDANAPQISLVDLLNDTSIIYAAGKMLEVNITDFSPNIEVNYKWNDNIFLPWTPSEGTIYRTHLPETNGYHNLTITAEDQFGLLSTNFYMFNVSTETLLVELRTMSNESWYYGGDTVEVTVSGTNNTLVFSWDGNSFQDGNPFLIGGQILTLDGVNALPTELNYYHYLTIIVGSIDHEETTFVFEFKIDIEYPVIDSSILDYNNTRFKNSDTFVFIISDNATLTDEFLVLISIDGNQNITLNSPFELDLALFSEGLHNFTIYVSDIAGNQVKQFIIFYVDSSAPLIEIINFEGLVTLPDTSRYVPYASTIHISINDDDPSYTATYSWDGSDYQLFSDTIVLDYSDGYGILVINASDSIGNERIITYELTIDGQSPEITIIFPFEYSTINDYTNLIFNAEDVSQNTIESVEFYWDVLPAFSSDIVPDSNGDFEVILLPLYSTGEFATLAIYAEDIVGNNYTHLFVFEIDITPPNSTLYIYSDELGEYVDASTFDYIQGGTNIWYNSTSCPDLSVFIYSWDNNESLILNDPWIIQAPTSDGEHNLSIILRDNTGESTSPNEIEIVLFFIIDDIEIEVVEPVNLLDETHNLVYKEIFTFTIKIYDTLDNLSVPDLIWQESALTNLLNLEIVTATLDPITFEFTITANNVGNTSLIFEFSSDYSNNHSITIDLLISKREGNLIILETSESTCIYEENITINVNLKDEFSNDLEVTSIAINGSTVDFWLDSNNVYQFEFLSTTLAGKGNYILLIVVESEYYFGETNDSYTYAIEIDPIPLVLTIDVSNLEIIQGSTVVVTATLTYLNGTQVIGSEITFNIYIYYKSGQGTVNAAIEGYDNLVILSAITGLDGRASVDYLLTEEIDQIAISATYEGSDILSDVFIEFEETVKTIKAGLSPVLLYSIIGGSIALLILVSFIVYKYTKRKPFSKYLDKIDSQDLIMKLNEVSPGVVLSIFDQKKGPIPLLSDHSLDFDYGGRINIEIDNFILKICDQSYSSLGFEDVHKGRKVSTINLPNEGLVGFIHAIQLENKSARSGYENLSVIMLTQEDYGNYLLAYSEFIYKHIDDLISKLKQELPLSEIKQQIIEIRQRTVQVILAAIEENE